MACEEQVWQSIHLERALTAIDIPLVPHHDHTITIPIDDAPSVLFNSAQHPPSSEPCTARNTSMPFPRSTQSTHPSLESPVAHGRRIPFRAIACAHASAGTRLAHVQPARGSLSELDCERCGVCAWGRDGWGGTAGLGRMVQQGVGVDGDVDDGGRQGRVECPTHRVGSRSQLTGWLARSRDCEGGPLCRTRIRHDLWTGTGHAGREETFSGIR